jgi:hypothetical protein
MWTYDLAREQSPTLENLQTLCKLSLDSGYNALGLYLEHRFAFPSTPWMHGTGAVTPQTIEALQKEFKELQIIPFLNLLSHIEGFIYTEKGRRFAEEKFRGTQACPSIPEFVEVANGLLEDTLNVFQSEIIHIGGDEAQQLDKCPRCQAREYEAPPNADTSMRSIIAAALKDRKAYIYGSHMAPLAQRVIEAGGRPAIWGDMLLEHPHAADWLPKETLIFDWQYFEGPHRTSTRLKSLGFDVVTCPTLQTYNAMWLHLPESEANVLEHIRDAIEMEAEGVCLTTWELALMGSYETILPAIRAVGNMLRDPEEFVDAVPHADERPTDEKLKDITVHKHGELEGIEADEDNSSNKVARLATAIIVKLIDERIPEASFIPEGDSLLLMHNDAADPRVLLRVPGELKNPLTNRLRLLAGLPAVGRRLPQSGEINGTYVGNDFRFRVNSEPVNDAVRLTITRLERIQTVAPSLSGTGAFLACYGAESQAYREWAELLGVELQKLGGPFAHSGTRSSLKVRLLLQGNPFLAWLYHGEELAGETGAKALEICEMAMQRSPDAASRGVAGFIKQAVNFVRYAEEAHQAYANDLPGVAAASLAPARQVFEELEKIAKANNLRFGGSLADVERCKAARSHVETVIRRVKEYGDGHLGYLPSFEHLTHPKFIPHDQGAWWLINRWAHE